ncbi:ankyrin [Tuber magnatum]|uniref:Ankyrin n=1 Tax=Tuber magnatum TaxID=42249 RepID=A0A317SVC3_9PEZI|nr:ankyrin [Tuber magnatum]
MSMQQTYAYPENTGKSKKPRVYARAEWAAQRERIKLHYFDEGRNLTDVKELMSSLYDFHATEKQYKTRIKVWGLEKKVKTEEMKAIIRIREKRKREGKDSTFLVRKRIVPDQKIERFKRSHKEPTYLESPPPTPSDIECFTPRPDDGYSPLGSSPDNADWGSGPWEPIEEPPKCSYTRSNTPLHEAARSGNSSEVQLLLESGHSYNQKNLFGQTPLHIAAANGCHCVVQILLEADASVETLDDYSWTPLQCASRNGHSSVVRKLLEWGADVGQTDDFHRTPLHWAAANGHERIQRTALTQQPYTNFSSQELAPTSLIPGGSRERPCTWLPKLEMRS